MQVEAVSVGRCLPAARINQIIQTPGHGSSQALRLFHHQIPARFAEPVSSTPLHRGGSPQILWQAVRYPGLHRRELHREQRDPDSVVLCLLAIDEEDEGDIALQIHFTLIQAFCCDNDINILRVSGMQRLAKVLGESLEDNSEPRDLHCILVTNPHTDSWKSQGLAEVASYCEESRCNNQWVPYVSLLER
ncbi:Growth arrest and DNA damage-inducible protein GADD45 beta [Chelonia mydas]|uniref:Growth arrest and DNA damage-inducible protein GADD45 beta n=1 Tax=Chelonia mydas TaxID=8469 RepID=M7AWH1_CHEMY|nr:Growth arrest and DNA damage-inducible protein GADD45 beta [Chelonia mydas]